MIESYQVERPFHAQLDSHCFASSNFNVTDEPPQIKLNQNSRHPKLNSNSRVYSKLGETLIACSDENTGKSKTGGYEDKFRAQCESIEPSNTIDPYHFHFLVEWITISNDSATEHRRVRTTEAAAKQRTYSAVAVVHVVKPETFFYCKAEILKIDCHRSDIRDLVGVQIVADYQLKFGLGMLLSNGAVEVYFNDSTIMYLSPDHLTYCYVEKKPDGTSHMAATGDAKLQTISKEHQKKFTLLLRFQQYLVRTYASWKTNCKTNDPTIVIHKGGSQTVLTSAHAMPSLSDIIGILGMEDAPTAPATDDATTDTTTIPPWGATEVHPQGNVNGAREMVYKWLKYPGAIVFKFVSYIYAVCPDGVEMYVLEHVQCRDDKTKRGAVLSRSPEGHWDVYSLSELLLDTKDTLMVYQRIKELFLALMQCSELERLRLC